MKIFSKIRKLKKTYFLIAILIIVISLLLFIKFSKNTYKKLNIGNTNINQTLDNVKEYILKIKVQLKFPGRTQLFLRHPKNSYELDKFHLQI